jgi:hypothetical protein
VARAPPTLHYTAPGRSRPASMAAASSGMVESGRDYTHDYEYKYYYYYNQLIIRSVPWYFWAGAFATEVGLRSRKFGATARLRSKQAGWGRKLSSCRFARFQRALPPLCTHSLCPLSILACVCLAPPACVAICVVARAVPLITAFVIAVVVGLAVHYRRVIVSRGERSQLLKPREAKATPGPGEEDEDGPPRVVRWCRGWGVHRFYRCGSRVGVTVAQRMPTNRPNNQRQAVLVVALFFAVTGAHGEYLSALRRHWVSVRRADVGGNGNTQHAKVPRPPRRRQ